MSGEEDAADDFILRIEPSDSVVFSGLLSEDAVTVILRVTNPTQDRLACKIKSTSNEMFKIRPPVFALNPGEVTDIKITFNAGYGIPSSHYHYFVVYHIKAVDAEKKPRVCWTEHKGKPDGCKKLFFDFRHQSGPWLVLQEARENAEKAAKSRAEAAEEVAKGGENVEEMSRIGENVDEMGRANENGQKIVKNGENGEETAKLKENGEEPAQMMLKKGVLESPKFSEDAALNAEEAADQLPVARVVGEVSRVGENAVEIPKAVSSSEPREPAGSSQESALLNSSPIHGSSLLTDPALSTASTPGSHRKISLMKHPKKVFEFDKALGSKNSGESNSP